jgi:hypothetical protein
MTAICITFIPLCGAPWERKYLCFSMKPKTRPIYLSYLPQLSQDRFLVAPYGTAETEWPEVTSPSCCLALPNFHWQQIFSRLAVCTVLIFHLNENSTEQYFFFSRSQQSLSLSEFLRLLRDRRSTTAFTRAHIPDPAPSKTSDLTVTALYCFGMWRFVVCWKLTDIPKEYVASIFRVIGHWRWREAARSTQMSVSFYQSHMTSLLLFVLIQPTSSHLRIGLPNVLSPLACPA